MKKVYAYFIKKNFPNFTSQYLSSSLNTQKFSDTVCKVCTSIPLYPYT